MAYSVRVACLATNNDRVIVSTDSERYASIAAAYGGEAPSLRPPEISGDQSTDCKFMLHALAWFRENEDKTPDYLVHLRPTTPLREVKVVEQAVSTMLKGEKVTAFLSIHEMADSAYKCLELDGRFIKTLGFGGFDLDAANAPRQVFPKTFAANGYVDVLRSAFVVENYRLRGNRALGYVTSRATEVDTIEDFEYLEYEIRKRPEMISMLFK